MHPKVIQLANHFGAKFSDRVSYSVENGLPGNFTHDKAHYDGETIATKILLSNGAIVEKDDHTLMHEIGHYAVASKEQRELPEYGLGTPIYGLPLGEKPSDWGMYSIAIPSVVDQIESETQEHMTQYLCVLWGSAYGLSSAMVEEPTYIGNWHSYFFMKTDPKHNGCKQHPTDFLRDAHNKDKACERIILTMWNALFRLRDNGLMRII